MGLFSNHKKTCPICGEPTPRLFSTKIDGSPLCKECANKADLPEDVLNRMSVDDFRQYMELYNENQVLRDKFTETDRFSFGIFGGAILVDTKNKLLRLKDDKYAWVFEAAQFLSFCVLEDGKPLFEGTKAGLKCYPSEVPGRLNDLAPEITRIIMSQRGLEVLEKLGDKVASDDKSNRPVQQYIEFPVPLQQFQMEIQLEHPYWTTFYKQEDGPRFDRQRPSIENYRNIYENRVSQFHAFAECLMQLINVNAKGSSSRGTEAGFVQQPVSADNAVAEIQKYKALLDSGMITEEEFAAKKRQILGI